MTLLDLRPMAGDLDRQVAEAQVRVPVTKSLRQDRLGKGETRRSAGLCNSVTRDCTPTESQS
ncbi:hypothetical protein ATI53_103332 [Salipiger aestuarii]|uniref:Uncharacterized protein n=1 Tax=Salipiger aestuarii TaxID=568098 RepID=A0A327Y1F2_9RHOB|nr:hypothetical protein ATI53_103332 [Salipiger aestuarii]